MERGDPTWAKPRRLIPQERAPRQLHRAADAALTALRGVGIEEQRRDIEDSRVRLHADYAFLNSYVEKVRHDVLFHTDQATAIAVAAREEASCAAELHGELRNVRMELSEYAALARDSANCAHHADCAHRERRTQASGRLASLQDQVFCAVRDAHFWTEQASNASVELSLARDALEAEARVAKAVRLEAVSAESRLEGLLLEAPTLEARVEREGRLGALEAEASRVRGHMLQEDSSRRVLAQRYAEIRGNPGTQPTFADAGPRGILWTRYLAERAAITGDEARPCTPSELAASASNPSAAVVFPESVLVPAVTSLDKAAAS
eukprot:TRINITY_DN42636_c0_g1_i1.p1 TRINITY_DN42636_c0_g1~~TRINITY_DN42636_c0_g1_i1.p1  ORF type:complete len:361 (+),score=58.85 TRINITY_DN42636_c0_g1_i1:122-1084(+)